MNSIKDALQTFYGLPSRARSAHVNDCVVVCCSCVLCFNYLEAYKITNLACWLRTSTLSGGSTSTAFLKTLGTTSCPLGIYGTEHPQFPS